MSRHSADSRGRLPVALCVGVERAGEAERGAAVAPGVGLCGQDLVYQLPVAGSAIGVGAVNDDTDILAGGGVDEERPEGAV